MGEKNLLRQLANLHRPHIICFSYTHTLSTLLPIHTDTFALYVVVVSCTAKNTLQLNTSIFAQASYHLFLLHTTLVTTYTEGLCIHHEQQRTHCFNRCSLIRSHTNRNSTIPCSYLHVLKTVADSVFGEAISGLQAAVAQMVEEIAVQRVKIRVRET